LELAALHTSINFLLKTNLYLQASKLVSLRAAVETVVPATTPVTAKVVTPAAIPPPPAAKAPPPSAAKEALESATPDNELIGVVSENGK
jgi:hypothetical protein